jgi:hypothetical protein
MSCQGDWPGDYNLLGRRLVFKFFRSWLPTDSPVRFLDFMHDYFHSMCRNAQIYKDLGYVFDQGFGFFLPKTFPDIYMNNGHFHLLCWLAATARPLCSRQSLLTPSPDYTALHPTARWSASLPPRPPPHSPQPHIPHLYPHQRSQPLLHMSRSNSASHPACLGTQSN